MSNAVGQSHRAVDTPVSLVVRMVSLERAMCHTVERDLGTHSAMMHGNHHVRPSSIVKSRSNGPMG